MTQIPAILPATPRVVPESTPATEATTEDTSGSGTFDAALALAVGQITTPAVRPIVAGMTVTVGPPVEFLGEELVPIPVLATSDEGDNPPPLRAPVNGRVVSNAPSPNLASLPGASLVLRADPRVASAPLAAPMERGAMPMNAAADAAPMLDVTGAALDAEAADVAESALRMLEVRGSGRLAVPATSDLVREAPRAAHPATALPVAADTLGRLESAERAPVDRLAQRVPVAQFPSDIGSAPRAAETANALRADLPAKTNAENAEAAVRPNVPRPAETPLHKTDAPILDPKPVVDRGESVASLGARVVSLALGGEVAASGDPRATTRRAARGAAIASAVTEGVKEAAAPRLDATPARANVERRDTAARDASAEAPARAARKPDAAPAARPVADERPVEAAPIATVAGKTAPPAEPANAATAVKMVAAPSPEEPLLAPRGDRVTLSLEGEHGVEGRVRIALRGERVHATLVSHDGTTIENWNAGLDQLRRSLGDRGFAEPRVAIQHASKMEVHDTAAFERSDQKASREGQRESHNGGNSREAHREAHEERLARRSPRQQSEKEQS